MRTTLLALVLVLVCADASLAQTGTPSEWILNIYPAGSTGNPLSSVTVAAAQVQCNQPVVTGPNTNPTTWRWGDIASPKDAQGKYTRDCVYNDSARLTALADGNYDGAALAANADGPSSESAPRYPFSRRRANPPAAPTDLRLTQ